MGLVCTSRLLELVPALITSIKEAGLVLMADHSFDTQAGKRNVVDLEERVDGLLVGNAVLKFRDTVEQ